MIFTIKTMLIKIKYLPANTQLQKATWPKAARGNCFRFDGVSSKMNLILHTRPCG